MTGHDRHVPPHAALPALHRPFKDPVFGTCITRIGDASQWPGLKRIRHYYSKANPFNSDNSRAILWGSDGTYLLYDTKSWKPIRDLHIGTSDAEVSWHPTDPNVFYHLDMDGTGEVRTIFRCDIAGEGKKHLRSFSEYTAARGKLEGNLDAKGRYYAMVGKKSENEGDQRIFGGPARSGGGFGRVP